MLHAQQRALLQQTNQGIINIRNYELEYYTTFYGTFGGQSALIGGFVYSAVTQATINYGWQELEFTSGMLLGFWWFFSAISLGAALHCLFTTIMLQVLGPGLGNYILTLISSSNSLLILTASTNGTYWIYGKSDSRIAC